MYYRFNLGQDLYEYDNNKLVTIVKRYPLKKNDIPVFKAKTSVTGKSREEWYSSSFNF
jgi:hypothetical protein